MKQGQAQTSKVGSTKVEPRSTAVSPMKAGMPGIAKVFVGGRGMVEQSANRTLGTKAPMSKSEVHYCGSQGKHK